MGRRRRPWHAVIAAAAVLTWSPAWTDDEPLQFRDAVKLYQAKKYAEAFSVYEALAKEWDSRAQVLLGNALVQGSQIPRDIPRGIAWLRIAAGDSNVSPTTRNHAAQQLRVFEPALSGADLIRADAVVGELFAEREREHRQRIGRAYDRLVQAEPMADDIKEGCALDTALTDCRIARADVKGSVAVCLPAEDVWPGALEDRKSWRRIEPKFPDRGLWSGWEGKVEIAAHVDGSGWVCRATVANGSGFRELDSAALDAVRRWRFTPRVVDGKATPYMFNVSVNFVQEGFGIKAR
jgi:protein TonB